LNLERYPAVAIHGDKCQTDREYALASFTSGKSTILVATDVAARGLDIKDVKYVINYDFPLTVEAYIHRVGRTGRAGANGIAYTFLTEDDGKHTRVLIKMLKEAK